MIFERRNYELTNSFEAQNQPMGYQGAKGGNVPTQNLVDAFERGDGTPFDWNNTEHVKTSIMMPKGKLLVTHVCI